ncbi:unnamed protein product [Sphagnum balticum]
MERLVSVDEPDEAKILGLSQSMRLRQGAYGRERIKAINYYFKQIMEMSIPDPQRYLTETALKKIDLFDPLFFYQ